ncbi:MAG: tyrosine-type recombinase/integrase [Burkholderiaceae bacterium]|jgi:integrase|nr:tyrosine-type recombinase/integrase [Burkholderiaceae bacterium]
MVLTDTGVKYAKATGKDTTLNDTLGLALFIGAGGGERWHFRFTWAGRQCRVVLGAYPKLSLKEARTRRDELRDQLAQGVDPRSHRRQVQATAPVVAEHTFKSVFRNWRDFKALSLKTGRQSTLSQIDRIFAKDVLPSLGGMSIFELNQAHLLGVLRRIEQRRAFTSAEKVRTWFKQMFRYAMVEKGLPSNPALELDIVAMPKPPVAHNPFLRMEDMPAFLQALRGYAGSLETCLGIRLLLLIGIRTGELRSATPEQFDLGRGLWIVPPEAVKQLQTSARKQGKRVQDLPPYIVPLPRQAIAIIEQLLALARRRPAQRYLLASRDCLKDCISENTLNGALKRMGYKNRLTGHGIRATISTALNEIGYRQEWIEAQLSHCDPNQVRAAYNHAAYVEQRRMMMQAWADRLDRWEAGDTGDLNDRSAIAAAPSVFTPHDMEVIEKYLKALAQGQVLPGMQPSGAAGLIAFQGGK